MYQGGEGPEHVELAVFEHVNSPAKKNVSVTIGQKLALKLTCSPNVNHTEGKETQATTEIDRDGDPNGKITREFVH